MRLFTLQIFSQTAAEQRLRLLDDQGQLLGERSLPQADIERFVTEVEKDYRASRLDLSALGRRLYEWLDGPTERWLATLRAQHPIWRCMSMSRVACAICHGNCSTATLIFAAMPISVLPPSDR